MSDLVEGGVLNFKVVAKNKFGTVVPVADAAVALDRTDLGSVTVNPDGSAGVFTAAAGLEGDVVLTPSAGGVTGTPFPVSVKADSVVASVELVPDTAPATVEIQPT
jgi:hypothetical protein